MWCQSAMSPSSSLYLQSELKNTRGLRLGDLPESGRVHVVNRQHQVDVVGHVEGLGAELQHRLFAECNILAERSVQRAIGWTIIAVALLVAELARVRDRIEPLKCRRRDPLRDPVRRSLVRVTDDIGTVAEHP